MPKPAKKTPRYVAARKSGDVVPPVPFCMKPTPHTLFVRQGLGGRSLMRAARHPNILISPKPAPKPSCESAPLYLRKPLPSLPPSCSRDTAEVHLHSTHCSEEAVFPQPGHHSQQAECAHISSEAADCAPFSHPYLPKLQGSKSTTPPTFSHPCHPHPHLCRPARQRWWHQVRMFPPRPWQGR